MATRAFLCVELDEGIRRSVAGLQKRLEAGNLVKWVEEENIHLTLKFMGDLSDEQVLMTSRILQSAVNGFESFDVELRGMGAFPTRQPPRVVWVGVKDDGGMLAKLAARLEESLEPVGCKKETRKYVPHLTIGRVRGTRGVRRLVDKISENRQYEAGKQRVSKLTFMKSDLTPSGPVYTPLERIYLDPGKSPR